MPGIAGIIGRGKPNERMDELGQMVKVMMHEPFYTSGAYGNNRLGLWIAWVGYPGSFSDCLPIWNETKDICLIFSGEDFSDRQTIDQLRIQGHKFELGDATYLVHLYEEMGLKFVEKINGWFCGLLVDCRQENIALFNDRYGIHRIFFHEGKDGIYFSSEAKSLLAVFPGARVFDPKGLGEFLTCDCTLGGRSLYRGVNILSPGSMWTFADKDVKKRASYFNVDEWIGQGRLDENRFLACVLNLFGDLVRRYSGGPLRVGISLTGGLDSRMVMAGLGKTADGFPCYTFGSMYRDTLDVKIGREVAEACKRPFYVLVLGDDFLKNLPRYLEKAVYISDGYIGLSGAAELYVNSLARNIAPVRITGNYGGELLRGHRAFKYNHLKLNYVDELLQVYLSEAQKSFQELESTDPVTFALFRQAPSQGYGRLAIERSQVVLRTPFMDNELVKLVYRAPAHLLKGEKLSAAIVSRYKADLLRIPTDRGFLGDGKSLPRMVRQVHRRALIKAEYLASHGMPNWLASIPCLGLKGILERSLLGRGKFQHFRLWSQKSFPGYIKEILFEGDNGMKDLFNSTHIAHMVNEHLTGRRNYIEEIDKLMTLALTNRGMLRAAAFRNS